MKFFSSAQCSWYVKQRGVILKWNVLCRGISNVSFRLNAFFPFQQPVEYKHRFCIYHGLLVNHRRRMANDLCYVIVSSKFHTSNQSLPAFDGTRPHFVALSSRSSLMSLNTKNNQSYKMSLIGSPDIGLYTLYSSRFTPCFRLA